MIAILKTYKSGGFTFQSLGSNIISGLIVGIVAMPLAMAFAIASGAKPEQGLYTSIISAVIVGIFGGTRTQIAGPTGAFIAILMTITVQHGIVGLQMATFMAGIILILMGVAKLGSFIKFIPDPVIVGFTSGIAVIIFIGQWDNFFGFPDFSQKFHHFHEKMIAFLYALPNFHFTTTILGFLSLGILIFAPKIPYLKSAPSPLVALVIVTCLQAHFGFSDVATIGSTFGEIPQKLPDFQIPAITLSRIIELAGPAFTIALLGAIESLLSATVADGMAGTRHNSNQELIGQGLANIICPFFGGFASTGAIARTATSIRNGATNPIAAIIHSLTLLIMILALAPLAYHIPLTALAAILFVVAYNMSEMHRFAFMFNHAPQSDIIILLTTFVLTVMTDLVVAVNVGVILSILLFTRRMSQSVHIDQEKEEHLEEELLALGFDRLPHNVLVYSVQGPFFFGAAETLERALSATHADPTSLILRLKGVPFMDVTGLQTFKDIIYDYQKRGVDVYLCEANSKVQQKLERMGILKIIHGNQVYLSIREALNFIRWETSSSSRML